LGLPAVATAASATTATATVFTRLGFIDGQGATFELITVKCLDGSLVTPSGFLYQFL